MLRILEGMGEGSGEEERGMGGVGREREEGACEGGDRRVRGAPVIESEYRKPRNMRSWLSKRAENVLKNDRQGAKAFA